MIVWHDFASFVSMGGYAGYVWGSFGAAAAAVAVELVALRQRRRTLRAEARRDAAARQPMPVFAPDPSDARDAHGALATEPA